MKNPAKDQRGKFKLAKVFICASAKIEEIFDFLKVSNLLIEKETPEF
ncbi:hypothetical protein LMED105_02103 [Limnobacter sp. MED105]|nr:hypothetical protein LMED105_02103 [Limnobacter sp. MED105]